jgi:hypothetical protein
VCKQIHWYLAYQEDNDDDIKPTDCIRGLFMSICYDRMQLVSPPRDLATDLRLAGMGHTMKPNVYSDWHHVNTRLDHNMPASVKFPQLTPTLSEHYLCSSNIRRFHNTIRPTSFAMQSLD